MDLARRITTFLVLMLAVLLGPELLAQATDTVREATGAATSTGANSANEWGGSIVWAFFSTSALEWIKRKPWLNLISEQTATGVQRVMGIVLATATAVGVHWTYDATAGRLIVEGLSLALIGEAVRQFVFNELTYRLAVKNYRKEG